jgi:tRNA pseudouridine38-40 synthase
MGTIEAAGAGKLSPDAVKRILEARARLAAPETAPPNGLFLMKVFYEESELQNYATTALPITY